MKCRCATVDCVLIWNNKIVLVRRGREPDKGKLALPGGFVELDETFEEACKREVKEETNLDVEIYKQIGVFDSPDREPRGCISVAFLGFGKGNAKAGDDAEEVVALDIQDALETARRGELAFDHSEILLQAFSSKKVEIAVKGLIWKGGEILVIKQRVLGKDVWDLPGGRIEYGESPEEALEREVLEEAGARISDIRLAGWTQFFRFDGSQTICMIFTAKWAGEGKKKGDSIEEITSLKWMVPEEFLSIQGSEYIERIKEILKDNMPK